MLGAEEMYIYARKHRIITPGQHEVLRKSGRPEVKGSLGEQNVFMRGK